MAKVTGRYRDWRSGRERFGTSGRRDGDCRRPSWPSVAVLTPADEAVAVAADTNGSAGLGEVLVAANAARNLGFGLVVGGVIAAGVYYAYVLSPEETLYAPSYYLGLAVVLGVSIALLLGIVLSVLTLVRLDTESHE